MNCGFSTLVGLSTICLLCACQGQQKGNETKGDTLSLSYAHNLTLVEYEDYTLASLRDPWDTTKVLHEYVLVERDEVREKSEAKPSSEIERGAKALHPQAEIVRVPLQKAAVFTAVHCALLQDLEAEQRIGGIADVEYIYLPYIQDAVKNGKIIDIGNSMEPNLERIMDLQPDALMPSPFQNSGGYGRIERIGIPIIECADYMEVSPLARAEWMKFYGRLFGCQEKADSLFAVIEKDYLKLRDQAQQTTTRPTLVAERLSGASWYVPAGQSTMGILYKDAGANYLWSDTSESGSLPLSLEAVMERGIEADIWIFKYGQDDDITYAQLAQDNPAYRQFKSFKEQRVYACNTQKTLFYEQTPFHPERLLANLLQIFHPELSISANNSYFCPVK